MREREGHANYVTKEGHKMCKLHLAVRWTMYMNQTFSPTASLIAFVPFADDAFLGDLVILIYMDDLFHSIVFWSTRDNLRYRKE